MELGLGYNQNDRYDERLNTKMMKVNFEEGKQHKRRKVREQLLQINLNNNL